MKKIISETEVMAHDYFKGFGFEDEQITSLISVGKKDLEINLKKLELLLEEDVISIEDVSNVLHALKGLLFQLGNHDVAEKLNESRSHLANKEILEEITQLLFNDK